MQPNSSPPEPRVSMKKGSWLGRSRSSRTRSGSRSQLGIKKQRSLTNVISSIQRVPSVKLMKNATAQKEGSLTNVLSSIQRVPSVKRLKNATGQKEARQEADGRRPARYSDERNVPTSSSLLDDDDDINDENRNDGNGWYFIDNHRSLHSLSLFESTFIDNTITKLHMLGYEQRGVDVYSLGALLRELIVWEKPFESLQESLDSLEHEEAMSSVSPRPKLNIDPFFTSLEHTLPLECTTSSSNALGTAPMTPKQMKRVICSVLEEMNVKVTKGGSGKGGGGAKSRSGARGNPPFTSSWNSLTSCYCGLY